jgi:Mor family transcriptional regulator
MNSKEALKTLKDIIGDEAYKKVIEQLGGVTVYFPSAAPNADWVDKEQRNLELKEDFYSGKYEVIDLAKKYELSISRVYKIIQGRA